MSRPRFSVVIPTRERPTTLHFAILTCLAQEFDDYEVVVCDNCGSPATRETCDQLNSPKLKYVRSSAPLAMSDNWELAVSYAHGDFITVIGDDDGLLRHALLEADRLIRFYNAPVIRWAWAYYKWPDYASQADAHRLSFRIGGHAELVQSRGLIRELISDPRRYHELPMIYNSFIHRDLIDRLRMRTGRVFKAISPDVYSGFAFADLTPEFVSVTRPMGICGTSSQSTGQAAVIGRGAGNEIAKEFFDISQHSGLRWNEHVPLVSRSISAVVAECHAQYKSNLHSRVTWTSEERKSLIAAMIRDLREHSNLSDDEWRAAYEKIQQWCRGDTGLTRWFNSQFGKESQAPSNRGKSRSPWRKGLGLNGFDIDASAFGVSDTDGVAALIENLCGGCNRPVPAHRARSTPMRHIAREMLPPLIYRAFKGSDDSKRKAS
jgi:glycosyltransferase involved in cell wall biosynthesis